MVCFFSLSQTGSFIFFFFQAEDGIRDIGVTGVQTCALPICPATAGGGVRRPGTPSRFTVRLSGARPGCRAATLPLDEFRSEERRVGKECRSRWSPYH